MKAFAFLQRIRDWKQALTGNGKQKGSALVIALLVILVLAMMGLALMLQSNTDYVIALNERDSTVALNSAEAGVELAKSAISNFSGTDFTSYLVGPDGDKLTTADNGIIGIKTIQSAITKDDLNDDCAPGSTTCEVTNSVIEVIGGKAYEVFRVGSDQDSNIPANKSGWDGPRSLVYVHVDDNHDDTPLLDDPTTDTDKRILVTVKSEYPIFVDSTGTKQDRTFVTAKAKGTSLRTLRVGFGPAQIQAAIITRGNMLIDGSLDICGECGGAHANQSMAIDPGLDDVCSQNICASATASSGVPTSSCSPPTNVVDGISQQPQIPVPKANPYGTDYVPTVATFDHLTDSELSGHTYLRCQLTAADPGASKYFAIVVTKSAPIGAFVYKAYRDFNNNRWVWRLIDNLERNTFEAKLDDCGRLTNGGTETGPDGSNFTVTADTGAGAPVNDAGFKDFYGLGMTPVNHQTATCTSDATLNSTTDNDDTQQAFAVYPTVAAGNPPNRNSASNMPALPNVNDGDGAADFVYADHIAKNKSGWKINANTIYSPLYNAVVFIYGNLTVTGSPANNFVYSGGSTAPPGARWRVTFVVFNNADISGTPAYAPAKEDFYYFIVAGRDLSLSGNAGGGYNACPGTGANCETPPTGTTPPYAGKVLVHEQLLFTGNVALDGTMSAEDAATCSSATNTDGNGIKATGSAAIHYDCIHPPSDENEGVTTTGWEEIGS